MTVEQVFSVSGMTCDHCVRAVTAEVLAIPGVEHVDVHLSPGQLSGVAVRSAEPIASDVMRAALDEAGYDLAE
jgi:copper chaperone CopZ